jgi:hypothetical protein
LLLLLLRTDAASIAALYLSHGALVIPNNSILDLIATPPHVRGGSVVDDAVATLSDTIAKHGNIGTLELSHRCWKENKHCANVEKI